MRSASKLNTMEKLANFINGKYVAPVNNEYIDNYEPATGLVYSLIPSSNSADVELAVAAAQAAFQIGRAHV